MVSVVVIEFSVMRCQPLRRALAFIVDMINYGIIK
ncbi:acetyltransferase [Vibrio cholerae]|nr:acetyltransferase [Vibrio cholerae]